MTKGKRGRLEGALRAWRGLSRNSRAYVLWELGWELDQKRRDAANQNADSWMKGELLSAAKDIRTAMALLRAAGVETRKERK